MIREVQPENFVELARWIHSDLPLAEFRVAVHEFVRRWRQAPHPMPLEAVDEIIAADGLATAVSSMQRTAAGYFSILPGNVATLGGLRIAEEHLAASESAVQLLNSLLRQLKSSYIRQIQAVVEPAAPAGIVQALKATHFRHLTDVEHWWWEPWFPASCQPAQADEHLGWQPAAEVPPEKLGEFLLQTFDGTLDCPQLNGRRTAEEVLDGFLDGRAYDRDLPWELLKCDGQPVGCNLLTWHPGNVVELTYLALLPHARGHRLGETLLSRAIEQARGASAELLVVSVDRANDPARALYRRFGFQYHRSLSVWLHEPVENACRSM